MPIESGCMPKLLPPNRPCGSINPLPDVLVPPVTVPEKERVAVWDPATTCSCGTVGILDLAHIDSNHSVSSLLAQLHSKLRPATLASMSAHEYDGYRGPRQLAGDPSAQRFLSRRTYFLSFLWFDEARDLAAAQDTPIPYDQGAIKVVTEIETQEHSTGQWIDARLGPQGLPALTDLKDWECTGNEEDPPLKNHLGLR